MLAQKKVGVIAKDTSTGPFVDEWKRTFGDASKEVEEVDITTALSAAALSVKDENELVRFRSPLGFALVMLIVIARDAERFKSMHWSYGTVVRRRNVRGARLGEKGHSQGSGGED